jgi:hypothetical protein
MKTRGGTAVRGTSRKVAGSIPDGVFEIFSFDTTFESS